MEARFKTFIFEPNKKKSTMSRRLTMLGWVSCLLIVLLLILEFDLVAFLGFVTLLTVCFGIAFSRWNTVQPLNGSLPFTFIINAEEIVVGNIRFDMNEVRISNLLCYDYFGRPTNDRVLFVKYPRVSNGTGNVIEFVYRDKKYRYQFLVASVREIFLLEDIVGSLSPKSLVYDFN